MKNEIVIADTTEKAKEQCPWANIFQRTEDYKETNKWICSSFRMD